MDPRLILGKLALAASIVAQATITQAAEPRAVPNALVPVLNAAERALKNGETKSAIKLLQSYQGDEDALLALMLGHSHQALKQFTQAEKHYRNALKLDASLKPAKLGLAQALVDQAKWKAASDILGEVVKVDHGSASELGLYARVAFELRDLRLASLLVERAIIRFPSELSFRRLDLALLMERNESKKAFEAARALLAKHPNDAQIWKQLAAITEDGEHIHIHLASLEAAVLANEHDQQLRRRYAMAQYQAGHFEEAIHTVSRLINQSKSQDIALIQLGVRVAEESDKDALAEKWLQKVPKTKRSKTLTLLEARLAIKSGDKRKARSALNRLIMSGEASPNVFLWAGQLAEQSGAMAKAESFYQQASHASGAAGRLAVLHLARLCHRINQAERASRLLSTYLAKHPDDEPARELLAVITQQTQNTAQN